MKAIEIAKKQIGSRSWYEEMDMSMMFVNSCYEKAGVDIGGFKHPQQAIENISKVGKKVYKDRLKQGDVCFIKLTNGGCSVGLFLRDCKNDAKFISVEACIIDGNFEVKEKIRKYEDAVFIRPEMEENEVKKTKKK
jgi:hypothetical protein